MREQMLAEDFEAEVESMAQEVLDAWRLSRHQRRFLQSLDGKALLAHLCNAAAKEFNPSFYEYKSDLIFQAIEGNPQAWQEDGIVYVETPVGQVSFHVFEGEDDDLPPAHGRVWCGLPNQWKARSMALGWLYHWPMWVIDLHASFEATLSRAGRWLLRLRHDLSACLGAPMAQRDS
jgi:hypothetical protein